MKKILTSVLFALLVSGQSFGALSTSLISYWALDEASGTRADKVVASANDLTQIGSPGSTTGKVYATAINLVAASSQEARKTDNASLSTGNIDFTIAAWFNATNVATTTVIASKWISSGNQREYMLRVNGSHCDFLVSSNGTATVTVTDATVLSNNTWYFVLASHDSVNDVIKISVNDGAVVSTSTSAGVFDSTSYFTVGQYDDGTGYFNGIVGPVMFWKKVLAPGEVTAVYNNASGLTYTALIAGHVIPTLLTFGSSTTNATSYATASITIHANQLVLLAYQYARDAGQAGTTTATSTGATWHALGSAVNYHTSGTPTRTIKVFYTMVGSNQTSAITVDHAGNTQDGSAWSVVEFDGVQTGGTDGSLAIGTPATMVGGSGATQVTCTVSSFSDIVNNVAYGAFGRSGNGGITPGTGFTELHDATYATPSNELETEWRIGYPTSGIVNATWAGGTDCACVGVEVKKIGTGLNPALLSALIDED